MDFYRLLTIGLSVIFILLSSVAEATISQLGSIYIITPQLHETDPYAAKRNRVAFQAKHGVLGSRLIESFGNGHFYPEHHGIYRRTVSYSYPRMPYYYLERK
ncbi:uncharacterized protein [Macrobrachium rosenbergii]|uniref:uncharacterized protein n=1 Tax=Macrobrachium rosenbergii TaxID=79674 RepID=UPI0034D5461E